jgi:hypothetical protein
MRRPMNRVIYISHFLYYLRIHHSWSSAVFCMQHEGRAWR